MDYTGALHWSYHGTTWAGQKGMYSILGWLYPAVYIFDSVESRYSAFRKEIVMHIIYYESIAIPLQLSFRIVVFNHPLRD